MIQEMVYEKKVETNFEVSTFFCIFNTVWHDI